MGKVIKRTATEIGDISPETGFADEREPPPVPGRNVEAARRGAVIDRDVFEARGEAQSIRERALIEAEEMRKNAEAECEEIKARAYEAGYAEGRDAGAAELSEVVATHVQRMDQIVAQAQPQLRDLAVAIARKILGRELEFHPDAVVDIVKQALAEKARLRREIFLRVNPADLQLIRDRKPDLLDVLSRAKEIGIREDPDVAPHGVIIETDAGTIDAQLETQLEVFERVLKNTH
jgi:type III secretion protein L